MIWGGMVKSTSLDYPGHLACVLFSAGCNLRCPWCHNGSLVLNPRANLDSETVFSFLAKRRPVLSGVVISGGEPTLHDDLPQVIARIKKLGYLIKLDTNGTNPHMITKLIDEGLIDYLAIDVKTLPHLYQNVAGTKIDERAFLQTLDQSRRIPHEYRLTVVPGLNDTLDVKAYGALIDDGPLYLQGFRKSESLLDGGFAAHRDCPYATLQRLKRELSLVIHGKVSIR